MKDYRFRGFLWVCGCSASRGCAGTPRKNLEQPQESRGGYAEGTAGDSHSQHQLCSQHHGEDFITAGHRQI